MRYWEGVPKGIDLISIVAAINSAGETLTADEAKSIIRLHGGRPEWVDNPPPWVECVNEALRKHHREG